MHSRSSPCAPLSHAPHSCSAADGIAAAEGSSKYASAFIISSTEGGSDALKPLLHEGPVKAAAVAVPRAYVADLVVAPVAAAAAAHSYEPLKSDAE